GNPVRQRIGEMPVSALDLPLLDLQVRDGRLELRVPVDQTLVAIDQAVLVQFDEHLADRDLQLRIQGEALAAPVTRGAQPAQLVLDRASAAGLPLPDLVDEGVAA